MNKQIVEEITKVATYLEKDVYTFGSSGKISKEYESRRRGHLYWKADSPDKILAEAWNEDHHTGNEHDIWSEALKGETLQRELENLLNRLKSDALNKARTAFIEIGARSLLAQRGIIVL